MEITPENIDSVTEMLLQVVQEANDTSDQSDDNLDAIATVFGNILNDSVVLDSVVRCIVTLS